ncbi:MAG: PspA/IM30 family protein [Actinomycetota bacterium]|nr:PspA/IM30 family protein [Actinomycetota bacterium]
MLTALRRWWKYLAAAFSSKVEEKADPKIQIEQAIEEAKRQHELLSQQAAAVVGNQKQLELKLGRAIEEVEKLQGSARQALLMADEARRRSDTAASAQYEDAAQSFAMKLVTEESSMKDLKGLHDQSITAALAARKAVETNALNLQKQLAERSKLLSQLDNAKMQERMNSALKQMNEISPKGDVPSLAEVRDKIETRYAKALGESEIRTDSVGSKMMEVEKAQLDAEAASRLDALRTGLGLAPASSGPETSSTVETGQAATAGTTSETPPQEQVKEGGDA